MEPLTDQSKLEIQLGGVELDHSYSEPEEHVIIYSPFPYNEEHLPLINKTRRRAEKLLKRAARDKWFLSEHNHKRDEMLPCFINRLEREFFLADEMRKINPKYYSLIESIDAFAIKEHPDAGGKRSVVLRYKPSSILSFTQQALFVYALGRPPSPAEINELRKWALSRSIFFTDKFCGRNGNCVYGELSPQGKYLIFSEDYLSKEFDTEKPVVEDFLRKRNGDCKSNNHSAPAQPLCA